MPIYHVEIHPTLTPKISYRGGEEIEAVVRLELHTIVDRNYGADRDGNRGEQREELDEVVLVSIEDDNQNPDTRPWLKEGMFDEDSLAGMLRDVDRRWSEMLSNEEYK